MSVAEQVSRAWPRQRGQGFPTSVALRKCFLLFVRSLAQTSKRPGESIVEARRRVSDAVTDWFFAHQSVSERPYGRAWDLFRLYDRNGLTSINIEPESAPRERSGPACFTRYVRLENGHLVRVDLATGEILEYGASR